MQRKEEIRKRHENMSMAPSLVPQCHHDRGELLDMVDAAEGRNEKLLIQLNGSIELGAKAAKQLADIATLPRYEPHMGEKTMGCMTGFKMIPCLGGQYVRVSGIQAINTGANQ